MRRAFDILGPLRVRIDGVDVTPHAPRERSLLALLVAQPGHVVSADRMIDELWSNLPPEQARRVLWVRVSGLRKLLNRAGAGSLLELVTPGYRLAIDADDVDAQRFLALAAEGRRHRQHGDAELAAGALRRALDLWRGEPLVDAQGCLALEAEAARLSETRLDAVEEWIDAELACGRHEAVHVEVCSLAAEHPLRERLGRQRALCLSRSGRHVEALAACRELRERLSSELGLDPGPELERLEHEIIVGGSRAATEHADPSSDAIERRTTVHRSSSAAAHDASLRARVPLTTARPHLSPHEPRAARHNLPVELTRFVGRAAELQHVAELLASFRLLTLTGIGGVGKTRLALAAAAAAVDRCADGVWLIELAALSSDAAVPTAFARALGIMVTGDPSLEDLPQLVARHLAPRGVLLVVDTAERVLDGVARLVHELLASCPDLTVLVTSRERLHVPGEAVFAVPPLALPPSDDDTVAGADAVALFCDRAQAARAGSVSSAAELAAAATICRRVDGIPLAIELAAARVHAIGVEQIAERLDDRFALLEAERATGVPERHQTMRATLDWSHELLTPAERAALRHLAVFPGEFDLDAAVAVLEAGGETARRQEDGAALVSRLVDKSLVVVVASRDGLRYRLLDPIRQYAAEKLAAAGETETLRARHRDVFLVRHQSRWPLMTARERERVCADRENLIAALEWSWQDGDAAAALRLAALQGESWLWMGEARSREWLERALAEADPLDPARGRALNQLALALSDTEGRDAARIDALMGEAREIAERLGDARELAACQLAQADIVVAKGRVDAGRSLTEAALKVYERLGEATGVGWCHYFLGWVDVGAGDVPGARSHFDRATVLARSTPGAEWLVPHALAGLAPVVASLGDSREALRLADESVSSARPFAVPAVLAMALTRAAEAAVVAGDDLAAATMLGELLQLLHDLGTRRWAGDALELVAVVLEHTSRDVEAAVALGTARALREAAGAQGGGVRVVAGEVRRSAGRLRAALGAGRLAALDARGRALSPEVAMADMVGVLDALRIAVP